MAYICASCGKESKSLEKFVLCPYCGGRMMLKKRPNVSREVSTD
ncbi:DNA-directed RNA polymerase subunit P [Candidatus Marsarchaeota archaeon]|jgi:DNA-directed RNA polymerase subunit RPC12/RpoP|nr:DNA-directed RNA polymerase subunit P [Candidatus Marsarchaeota archaeon]MCL5092223.1 DNA-directed RNA polymerase subunit P [Candidatus Marsarchaeota archaeon]